MILIKITHYNSDGLIKCLPPTHDNFVPRSKIYARNFFSVYKILWRPDSFVSRDSIFGLAGRRAGASFFARHRDYFIVTRNFTAIYRDLVPFRSFTVTRNCSSVYRDWQKTRHPDADANSLNRRAVRLQCAFIAICPLAPGLFCGAIRTVFLLRDR
jgi:hypothetical protein